MSDNPQTNSAADVPAAAPVPPPEVHLTGWGLAGLLAGVSLLTLCAAVLVSLGLLAALNKGLIFSSRSSVADLQRRVQDLETQSSSLTQDYNGLKAQIDTLAGLSGRMSAVEDSAATLGQQVEGGLSDLDDMRSQLTDLSDQMDSQEESIQAFDRFLAGLKNLLVEPTPQPKRP